MNAPKELAQQLFNKIVTPIMGLPLTDDAIKEIGIELTYIVLDEIFNRNVDQSKHDFYCNVHGYINEVEF